MMKMPIQVGICINSVLQVVLLMLMSEQHLSFLAYGYKNSKVSHPNLLFIIVVTSEEGLLTSNNEEHLHALHPSPRSNYYQEEVVLQLRISHKK